MIQDKMAKADQERIKALLKETITLLCKNGLTYSSEFSVEALIGITLDKEDVFLVNIKETIAHPNAEKESDSEGEVEERGRRPSHSSSSTPRRDTSNPPTPQRDSRDAGSPAQTPRSFSRQLAERKRAASQDNSNTSLPNITESFGWDGASPAKRSRDYKDEITDVVVIKEESGSEDDKDSCMISSGPPQLNQGSMGQDFRLDQSQLIPVPGNVLPGCSAWSTMPGTQGAALSLQGPPPPGMGVQGQPLNLLGGEPPNTSSDGSETELVPGSGVYIPTTVYHSLNQEYFPKGSKLVRRLVHTIFPDDYELANSSCLGKRGDSCHKGLDQRKVEAIKDFTQRSYPEMLASEVIQAINVCCAQARQKYRKQSARASQPPSTGNNQSQGGKSGSQAGKSGSQTGKSGSQAGGRRRRSYQGQSQALAYLAAQDNQTARLSGGSVIHSPGDSVGGARAESHTLAASSLTTATISQTTEMSRQTTTTSDQTPATHGPILLGHIRPPADPSHSLYSVGPSQCETPSGPHQGLSAMESSPTQASAVSSGSPTGQDTGNGVQGETGHSVLGDGGHGVQEAVRHHGAGGSGQRPRSNVFEESLREASSLSLTDFTL